MSFISKITNFVGDQVGSLTGAKQQAEGAERASQTQSKAALAGIDEQRRQFDALQAALSPYMGAGPGALTAQQNMLGLNGQGAQQASIDSIQNGAQFRSLQQQGNEAILANASATGGLRGGNTQAALAQFSPQLLQQLIQQQYQNLGGLTSIGQNAAAGVGNAGMQTGANVSNLLQQQGAALAGGQMAAGGMHRQAFGDLLKIGSTIAGAGGF